MRINLTKKDLVNAVYMQLGFSKQISENLIEDFLLKETTNKFEVLFIDEAQDLSLLQWEMVRKIWARAGKTYIAGDDDQAIFKWAGADVDHFIALKEEVDDIQTCLLYTSPSPRD